MDCVIFLPLCFPCMELWSVVFHVIHTSSSWFSSKLTQDFAVDNSPGFRSRGCILYGSSFVESYRKTRCLQSKNRILNQGYVVFVFHLTIFNSPIQSKQRIFICSYGTIFLFKDPLQGTNFKILTELLFYALKY